MAETDANQAWKVIAKSVRGAAHERSGLPNQDALSVIANGGMLPVIVAISDGHGSSRCFRSHLGSQFAVDAAIRACQQFLKGDWTGSTPMVVKRTAEQKLPQQIVLDWQEQVRQHASNHPIEPVELELLTAKEGPNAEVAFQQNPLTAYGATLLLTVVTPDFLLYMQLGDGDIMTVDDAGEVSRPLPKDERLFANETTSVSGSKAWQDFRVSFHPYSPRVPALILLSTDGYSNSFREDAGFMQAGSDLLELLRTEGPSEIRSHLEEWLRDSSAKSGDDVTLGLVYRDSAIAGHVNRPTMGASGNEPSARPEFEPPLSSAEIEGLKQEGEVS